MRKIVPDDRARQGPSGRPVLGVLIGSLALLAVAVGGYLVWVGISSPDNPSQEASRAAVTGSTSGSGGNPTDRVSPANPAYPVPAGAGGGAQFGSQPVRRFPTKPAERVALSAGFVMGKLALPGLEGDFSP
jgi:hypothetical protein